MVRAIIFDFDGVLVNSNAIKRDAYFQIFEPAGIAREQVEKILHENPDADRIGVIAGVLNEHPGSAQVAAFAEKYNAICESGAVACPEIQGVSTVLPQLNGQYWLGINSDTPENVLKRIVGKRGWTTWFREVRGRPASKVKNLSALLRSAQVTGNQAVYVGDKQVDWGAAASAGVQFIGMRNAFNNFGQAPEYLIDSIDELPNMLQKVSKTIHV